MKNLRPISLGTILALIVFGTGMTGCSDDHPAQPITKPAAAKPAVLSSDGRQFSQLNRAELENEWQASMTSEQEAAIRAEWKRRGYKTDDLVKLSQTRVDTYSKALAQLKDNYNDLESKGQNPWYDPFHTYKLTTSEVQEAGKLGKLIGDYNGYIDRFSKLKTTLIAQRDEEDKIAAAQAAEAKRKADAVAAATAEKKWESDISKMNKDEFENALVWESNTPEHIAYFQREITRRKISDDELVSLLSRSIVDQKSKYQYWADVKNHKPGWFESTPSDAFRAKVDEKLKEFENRVPRLQNLLDGAGQRVLAAKQAKELQDLKVKEASSANSAVSKFKADEAKMSKMTTAQVKSSFNSYLTPEQMKSVRTELSRRGTSNKEFSDFVHSQIQSGENEIAQLKTIPDQSPAVREKIVNLQTRIDRMNTFLKPVLADVARDEETAHLKAMADYRASLTKMPLPQLKAELDIGKSQDEVSMILAEMAKRGVSKEEVLAELSKMAGYLNAQSTFIDQHATKMKNVDALRKFNAGQKEMFAHVVSDFQKAVAADKALKDINTQRQKVAVNSALNVVKQNLTAKPATDVKPTSATTQPISKEPTPGTKGPGVSSSAAAKAPAAAPAHQGPTTAPAAASAALPTTRPAPAPTAKSNASTQPANTTQTAYPYGYDWLWNNDSLLSKYFQNLRSPADLTNAQDFANQAKIPQSVVNNRADMELLGTQNTAELLEQIYRDALKNGNGDELNLQPYVWQLNGRKTILQKFVDQDTK